MAKYEFDVALSFAGEDRAFVKQCASALIAKNLRVFYDRFEAGRLWGTDLYVHLDEIYRKKSRFCIVFLSQNYARKVWTNHERQSAQARALEENREYILPVKLDDTEIPGIRSTLGYLDARETNAEDIASLTVEKVKSGAL